VRSPGMHIGRYRHAVFAGHSGRETRSVWNNSSVVGSPEVDEGRRCGEEPEGSEGKQTAMPGGLLVTLFRVFASSGGSARSE
jgi:hypothetical protein